MLALCAAALVVAAAAVPLDRWERARVQRLALLRSADVVQGASGLPIPGDPAAAETARPPRRTSEIEIDFDRFQDLLARKRVVKRVGSPRLPAGLEPIRAALRAWENGESPKHWRQLDRRPLLSVERRVDALLVQGGTTHAQRRLILLELARTLAHQGRVVDAHAALFAARRLEVPSVLARIPALRARLRAPRFLEREQLDVPRAPAHGYPEPDPATRLDQALRNGFSAPWRRDRARLLRSLLRGDGEHRALLKSLRGNRDQPDLTAGQQAYLHAVAALRDGDLSNGTRLLEEAARYRETVIVARRLQAVAYGEQKLWKRAITAALLALALDPQDPDSLWLVGAVVCGQRLLLAAPHAPLVAVRTWARRIGARIHPKTPDPRLLQVHGTLVLLDALSGIKAQKVTVSLLRRGIVDLAAAHAAVPTDIPTALTTAVAHYQGAGHLPQSERKQARERAWGASYELVLQGRDVAGHPDVKALKKRFEVDIPENR